MLIKNLKRKTRFQRIVVKNVTPAKIVVALRNFFTPSVLPLNKEKKEGRIKTIYSQSFLQLFFFVSLFYLRCFIHKGIFLFQIKQRLITKKETQLKTTAPQDISNPLNVKLETMLQLLITASCTCWR